MIATVRDLWSGRLPLRAAFWTYGILYGLLVNLVATAGALIAYAEDAPGWLATALFLLPVPYLALATVGVWRSSARYQGSTLWPELARGTMIVVVLGVMLL